MESGTAQFHILGSHFLGSQGRLKENIPAFLSGERWVQVHKGIGDRKDASIRNLLEEGGYANGGLGAPAKRLNAGGRRALVEKQRGKKKEASKRATAAR